MGNDPLHELLYSCKALCDDPKESDDYSDSMASQVPELIPPGVQFVQSDGLRYDGKRTSAPYVGWRLEGFSLITYSTYKRIFVGHWIMLLAAAGVAVPEEITMSALAQAVFDARQKKPE